MGCPTTQKDSQKMTLPIDVPGSRFVSALVIHTSGI